MEPRYPASLREQLQAKRHVGSAPTVEPALFELDF